jgi:hypothetical protein
MDKDQETNEDVVLFQSSAATQLAPGEFEEHGLRDMARGLFGRKIEEVKADWKKVTAQIQEMIQSTESAQPAGFGLESVTISLGFNAKGQLVFIAEAGVEATVSVTFKRAGA